MRFSIYYLLAIVLSTSLGCKLIAEVSVNMTELLADRNKELTGDLYVEVPRCSDYSDVLSEARKRVPIVIKGAEYVECFKKDMDSLAHFTIPIGLSRNANIRQSPNINLIFNDNNELLMSWPVNRREEFLKIIRDISLATISEDIKKLGTPDREFKVTIKNDTGRNFRFVGIASYIGETPYTYNEARSIAGNSFVVTLSEVSMDRAVRYGTTTFFKKLD